MKEQNKKKSKKIRYVPFMSIFAAAIVLLLTVQIVYDIRVAVREQAVKGSEEITNEKVTLLDSAIEERINAAEQLLSAVDYIYSSETDENVIFEKVSAVSAGNSFADVYYVLEDGRIYDTAGMRREESAAARETIGTPVIGVSGSTVIPVYIENSTDGAVRSIVCYFYASEIYTRCKFSDKNGRLLYVYDSDGNAIFTPEEKTVQSAESLISSYKYESGAIDDYISQIGVEHDIRVLDEESADAIIAAGALSTVSGWYALTVLSTDTFIAYSSQVVEQVIIIVCTMVFVFLLMFIFFIASNTRFSRRIARQEGQDVVTGVNNQMRFESEVRRILTENKGTAYALLYINVANYKNINQIYGFSCADDAFRYVASVIGQDVRRHEVFGRANDGRFLLLVAYRDRDEIIERFRNYCERVLDFAPITVKSHKIKLSVGVYCIQDDKDFTPAELMDRAYYAHRVIDDEESGDAIEFYDVKMRDNIYRVSKIEADVEKSLKNGEFVMYMQPKYDLGQRRIYGAEALVRWIHPTEGMIALSIFIPIFEHNGFIREIDRFMLEEVCKYQRERARTHKRVVPISVNVSRVSIEAGDFVEFYIGMKKKYGIPDGFIELEFTESRMLESYEYLGMLITELRKNGFACSIDDFGAGYSSFKALKAINFDTIKLDMFFLEKSENRERDFAIIRGAIAMAKALGTKVIAEGVSELEDCEALKEMGCDAIQGYLYSKPLSRADFDEFIGDGTDTAPKL